MKAKDGGSRKPGDGAGKRAGTKPKASPWPGLNAKHAAKEKPTERRAAKANAAAARAHKQRKDWL